MDESATPKPKPRRPVAAPRRKLLYIEPSQKEEKKEEVIWRDRWRQEEPPEFACFIPCCCIGEHLFGNGMKSLGTDGAVLSLLEKIEICEPIWLLIDLNRREVEAILKYAEPGNFIIRRCSRPNCLALSVRSAIECNMTIKISHYAIQYDCGRTRFRLQFSHLEFESLAHLIEHYSSTSLELEFLLQLPAVLMSCEQRIALQSVALLKKDFWTSFMPRDSPIVLVSGSDEFFEVNDDKNAVVSMPSLERERPIPRPRRLVAPRSPVVTQNGDMMPRAGRSSSRSQHKSSCADRRPSKRSFLRSLFSFGSASKPPPLSQLATAEFFVPRDDFPHPPNRSQSAYQLKHSASDDKVFNAHTVRAGKLPSEQGVSLSPTFARLRNPAPRMARHLESSPEPPSAQRIPLRPPHNALDNAAMRNCVEELRRKRLQTADQLLLGEEARLHDLQNANIRPRVAGGSWRGPAREERLSIPALADESVVQSARAIREKFGRTCGGELQAINEGLVTPVVRRKKFTTHSDELTGALDCLRHVVEGVEPSSSSSSSTSRTPLGVRFHSDRAKPRKDYIKVQDEKNNNNEQLCSSWFAITNELKSRQKLKTEARLNPMSSCTPSTSQSDRPITPAHSHREEDSVSLAGTVFNEPWDSNIWDNLQDLARHGDCRGKDFEQIIEDEDEPCVSPFPSSSEQNYSDCPHRKIPSDHVIAKAWEQNSSKYGSMSSVNNSSNHETPLQTPILRRAPSQFSSHDDSSDDLPETLPSISSPLIETLRRRSNPSAYGASAIQKFVEKLAENDETIFGATILRFVECTTESDEEDPQIVIRNVRQFMNGIKNYLVKHGEGELHRLILSETSRLKSNQILNIDAILEAVLHKILLRKRTFYCEMLVVERIKPHLYHLAVKEHSRNGALQAISANLAIAKNFSLADFGFASLHQTPSPSSIEQTRVYIRKMQHHFSPLKKLKNLLKAISLICRTETGVKPSSDELVRWFVFLLSRTSAVLCEVEAWYMWELLPQQMITQGDAAFYLGALLSAVHILKNSDELQKMREDAKMGNPLELSHPRSSTSSMTFASDAFLRVAVPDEENGCIRYCTLPGVPQMSVAKVCKVIAHQQGITNPEDYGLYLLRSGLEDCLHPSDSPYEVRENAKSHHAPHLFVYKRHDAKIAWPQQLPVMLSPKMGSAAISQLSI